MKALGKQLLLELFDCNSAVLNDVEHIRNILVEAAKAANTTIIKECFHKFAPQGVSGILVIAESHFFIHTWPEHCYSAVDIFTCGNIIENQSAVEIIKKGLCAQKCIGMELNRGILIDSGLYGEKASI